MTNTGLRLFLTAGAAVLMLGTAYQITAAETGKDLYRTYCWQCHGSKGNGKGINAGENMSVQPRDHTDAAYMHGRTDEELFKAVKEGGSAVNKSVLMPPWGGTLSDDEIHALVRYLRELCRCHYGSAS